MPLSMNRNRALLAIRETMSRLPSLPRLSSICRWLPCIAALGASLFHAAGASAQERPNFVIIMADDMGYGDPSCYGNTVYETPCIDQLAAEGLRWTDFHSNGPVCSPTRAALVTGRYQQRASVPGVINASARVNRHHGLHADEITFAETLSEAGYSTAIIGKWHLGYQPQFNPTYQGFELFHGYISGNVCYQNHIDRVGVYDWWHNTELIVEEGYTTHLITQHAVDYIAAHAEDEQPFCLYIPHEAPHSPFQGPNDPPCRGEGRQPDPNDIEGRTRAYQEMVIELDRGVGEVVEALKEQGIAENTIVFFFSDNGSNPPGLNGPLRGDKGNLYEGGHRVPSVAWCPGTIAPGRETDETAMTLDIYPTMLDFAQVEAPSSHPLDGVSLKEILLEEGATLPERILFWEYESTSGNADRRYTANVRDGQWKLWLRGSSTEPARPTALYNLETDLGESEDVSAENQERVDAMFAAFLAWHEDVHHNASPQPERPAQE